MKKLGFSKDGRSILAFVLAVAMLVTFTTVPAIGSDAFIAAKPEIDAAQAADDDTGPEAERTEDVLAEAPQENSGEACSKTNRACSSNRRCPCDKID